MTDRPIPARTRMRRWLLPVMLAASTLVGTACSSGAGAGGSGLGGGYVGGGNSAGGDEIASGEGTNGGPFARIDPPSWDSSGNADGSGASSGATGRSSSASSNGGSSSRGGGSSAGTSGSQGSTGSGSTNGAPGDPATAGAESVAGAGDNKVFVLGDSVLLAAETMLPTQLIGWDVTIDAKVSRRIDAGITVLEQRRAELGAVAVVHLCTNYAKGENFAGKLDRVMQLLDGVSRIVLVTCVEWSPGQPEANAAIAAAAQKHPNVRIADWGKVARTAGYTSADGIHLLPPGVVAISKLIAAQIGPAPALDGPSLPTPPTAPSIDPSPGSDG